MSAVERMYLQFLFFAYSAVWVVMFGFLYRMLRRTRQLEEELAMLKEAYGPESKTPLDPGFDGPSM
ncbi:CcmD family protein [Sulfobacillus harzensis]|uniref:CcmD family protein n=1 Tax=Sulfobacillus harzensis TaxID=2729629 RepID=A0A7Y0Q426_9FIRM|nr:CcmD family protein [Sulfobacillus harzensis]NMP23581.1 CcmD family protein [Sulfobacillus harzensis]